MLRTFIYLTKVKVIYFIHYRETNPFFNIRILDPKRRFTLSQTNLAFKAVHMLFYTLPIIYILILPWQCLAQTYSPPLYKKITIPSNFLQNQDSLIYGGDIRIGDLNNDKEIDFIVYRAANSVNGGAVQPCFIGAFSLEGHALWRKGEGGFQPNRPGPVAIYDIDGDGETEVICLFANDPQSVSPFKMEQVSLQILNGQNGEIEHSIKPKAFQHAIGKGPNWVHQRILIANLSGNATPKDFIIKLGKTIYAFNHKLELLWTYFNPADTYQNCPAYIPAVGDVDNDGLDEINGGYYLLDQDGSILWERTLGKNMDSVSIDYWDNNTEKRAFCSGFGFIMTAHGDTILALGEKLVPHGQELRVADFDKAFQGPEMMIRYNGHKTNVGLFGQNGKLIRTFSLNESPNNTGMEAVYWNGLGQPALLYNGGALWTGKGTLLYTFQDLKNPPLGHKRQGWYHCIPVNFIGDDGEELILYNPWEKDLYIYTSSRNTKKMKPYAPTARQYNVRLMD